MEQLELVLEACDVEEKERMRNQITAYASLYYEKQNDPKNHKLYYMQGDSFCGKSRSLIAVKDESDK